eukprot:TRINITY_DN21273_c0_g2_i1.p1 TRINITY_DN21273_c0_g2~~TRINITY_DN21273_c0_g2_i1.p1  ORF type:complete len:410 (+),score=96.90 TRINITY_DN21273_c0_g2_i1:45-1232(+)
MDGALRNAGIPLTAKECEDLEERMACAQAAESLRLPSTPAGSAEQPKEDRGEKWGRSGAGPSGDIRRESSRGESRSSDSQPGGGGGRTETVEVEEDGLRFGGSGEHVLGVTPSCLCIANDRPQAAEPRSCPGAYVEAGSVATEVSARLQRKLGHLALIWEPAPDLHARSLPPPMSLSDKIQASIRSLEEARRSLLRDEGLLNDLFAKYYKVEEGILDLLLDILEQYKLQHQKEFEWLQVKYLSQQATSLDYKLSLMQRDIRRQTYTEEAIATLTVIRKLLEEQVQELQASTKKGADQLAEYKRLGERFMDLARRYGEASNNLENQRYLFQQLSRDLGERTNEAADEEGDQCYQQGPEGISVEQVLGKREGQSEWMTHIGSGEEWEGDTKSESVNS